jgi:hypothetical protein
MAKKNRRSPDVRKNTGRPYRTGTEVRAVSVLECGLDEAAYETMKGLSYGESKVLIRAALVDWHGNVFDAYVVTNIVIPVETGEDSPKPVL